MLNLKKLHNHTKLALEIVWQNYKPKCRNGRVRVSELVKWIRDAKGLYWLSLVCSCKSLSFAGDAIRQQLRCRALQCREAQQCWAWDGRLRADFEANSILCSYLHWRIMRRVAQPFVSWLKCLIKNRLLGEGLLRRCCAAKWHRCVCHHHARVPNNVPMKCDGTLPGR